MFDARGYSHGNRPDTWLKPGLSERLAELHRLNQSSFLEIAETLSTEFNIKVSRNAVIGRAKRMRLPERTPQPRLAAKSLPAKTKNECDHTWGGSDKDGKPICIKCGMVKVPVQRPAPRVSRLPGKSRNLTIYELRDGLLPLALR